MDGASYGFEVGHYDDSAELVIDPDLAWSTYFGGPRDSVGFAITTDNLGGIYYAGGYNGIYFPEAPPGGNGIVAVNTFSAPIGACDCIIGKFSESGAFDWFTYFGGTDLDQANAIVANGSEGIYVVGDTHSANFPTTTGAYDRSFNGEGDAFVAKFNSDGVLVWSTYFGGTHEERGHAVAVDSAGVYVGGHTCSSNLPNTGGWDGVFNGGPCDGFVAAFSFSGSLLWSTYFGGTGDDRVFALACDGNGALYAAGDTTSDNLPTTGGWDATYNGGEDAFVAKFASSGPLTWATYLGGGNCDQCRGIACSAAGGVFVVGPTASGDFPTPHGWQTTYGGSEADGYVAKFAPSGSLEWATYMGGSGIDFWWAVAPDGMTGVVAFGESQSDDFPVLNAWDSDFNGPDRDAVMAKFSPDGSLVWSTYLGGASRDIGTAVTVDNNHRIYVTGWTDSNNFPMQDAYDSSYNGGDDVYVSAFAQNLHTLTVTSYPASGVAITGSPSVTTDYAIEWEEGSEVCMTAPPIATLAGASYTFVKWVLNDVDQTAGQRTLSFTVSGDTTAKAVYQVVTRLLNVQSTPVAGADITGTNAGTTNYTTQVNDNTSVSLTAPSPVTIGGTDYAFQRWILNGVNKTTGAAELSFNIREDTTAVASYTIVKRSLTVQSTPFTSMVIGGNHAGITNYAVMCDDNAAVELIAPAGLTVSSVYYELQHWVVNGIDQAAGETHLDFDINEDTTAVAEYAVARHALQVQSTPLVGIDIQGSPAGTTDYSAELDDNTMVTLSAPGAVPGNYAFIRWTKNGAGQSYGRAGLTFTIKQDTTAVAQYNVFKSLKITGPTTVNEGSTAKYVCKLYCQDGTSYTVTAYALWTTRASCAKFIGPGRLKTSSVKSNQRIKVTARYAGKTTSLYVTIRNVR